MSLRPTVLLTSLLISAISSAQSTIELGQPSYGGNGCPQESASVSISPDGTALSILFDQYIVEAGGTTGKTIDRKSCNVSIPVQIPQGYSISVFSVDYRGFNAIPSGGRSQFNVEYFFAGQRGPRYTHNFRGPQSQDYTVSNGVVASALVWSACGARVNLRSNSSMLVQTNALRDQVLSTVDSADIQAGMIYHIQWRRCN